MKIVLAGATGFLGSPLVATLAAAGHDIVLLSRRPVPHGGRDRQIRVVQWDPDQEARPWAAEIDGAGAVVNLAGEPIAGRRWTESHKERIERSRVNATTALAETIAGAATPPPVFVSGSAVGFYGACGDEVVTEAHPAGDDFLARVCRRWEAAAMAVASTHTRVVCLRTGLVLATDGGALASMLLPFRLGLGGPVGSGRQYWPWIHRDDWVDMVTFAVTCSALSGPVNATGPAPATNREFTHALGRALHRPAFLPAPAFGLRLLFGEMADSLLLAGQRAVPDAALRHGFRFRYETVSEALVETLAR